MPSVVSSPRPVSAPRPAYRMLLLVALVFLLPSMAGSGLFWSGWRPERFSNRGELLQPPRAFPEAALTRTDGEHVPASAWRGHWLLVLPVSGACGEPCRSQLQQMQQVHAALGKDAGRLQRLLIGIGTADAASLDRARSRFRDLNFATVDGDTTLWQRAFDGDGQPVFIVDPWGNVILRYADAPHLAGALKDLERLLKYSWVR